MATPNEALSIFSGELDSRRKSDIAPRNDIVSVVRIYPGTTFPDLPSEIEAASFQSSMLMAFKTPGLVSKVIEASGRFYRDPVLIELNNLLSKLGGNEVEIDCSQNVFGDWSAHPEWWDRWKESSPIISKIYSEQIYPSIIRTLAEYDIEIGPGFVAVDLFGGDGELAESLSIYSNNQGEIHVIDQNTLALEKAKDRDGRVIVHAPSDLIEAQDILDGVEKPDLVTAVGGLCVQVLKRDESLNVARKVFEGLKEGGHFIVTGFSYVLLNAQDFRSLGFEVLQMSIPVNTYENAYPKQLYVLRKPVSE